MRIGIVHFALVIIDIETSNRHRIINESSETFSAFHPIYRHEFRLAATRGKRRLTDRFCVNTSSVYSPKKSALPRCLTSRSTFVSLRLLHPSRRPNIGKTTLQGTLIRYKRTPQHLFRFQRRFSRRRRSIIKFRSRRSPQYFITSLRSVCC